MITHRRNFLAFLFSAGSGSFAAKVHAGVVSEFGKNRTLSRVATLVMRGVLERVDVRLTYALN